MKLIKIVYKIKGDSDPHELAVGSSDLRQLSIAFSSVCSAIEPDLDVFMSIESFDMDGLK